MPFPDNSSLIDNFNRASLGANWTTGFAGDFAVQINASTTLTSADANNFGGGSYNATTYGPDVDLIFDVTTLTADFGIDLRCSNNTPDAGYTFVFTPFGSGGNASYLARWDTGAVQTQLGATFTAAFASGDKVGLEMLGSTLKGYRFTAGAWGAALASRTDATYNSAGRLATEIQKTGNLFDNMSGGTVGGDSEIMESRSSFVMSVP